LQGVFGLVLVVQDAAAARVILALAAAVSRFVGPPQLS
jgi:hypothetical protein